MILDPIMRSKAAAIRFGRAERGNVAMMFGLVLPVIFATIGAAIDYGRASKCARRCRRRPTRPR